MGNVNFFQKGAHAVRFGLGPGFRMNFLLQGACPCKRALRGSRTKPHVHPAAPSLTAMIWRQTPFTWQFLDWGWGPRAMFHLWCLPSVPATSPIKQGQSRYAKGQWGLALSSLPLHKVAARTQWVLSSGAAFCFSCLLVSHLTVTRQLCDGTGGLQETPKGSPGGSAFLDQLAFLLGILFSKYW